MSTAAATGALAMQVDVVSNFGGIESSPPKFDILPSTAYTLAAWLNVPVGKTVQMSIVQYDSSYVSLATQAVAFAGTGAFAQATKAFTSHASARYARVEVFDSVPGAPFTFYVDDWSLT